MPLARYLSPLKSRFINHRRIVIGNRCSNRNALLTAARPTLGLIFTQGGPVSQHTVDRRVVPFFRITKRCDLLSGEKICDGVTAEAADAKLENFLNNLGSLWDEDEGGSILRKL